MGEELKYTITIEKKGDGAQAASSELGGLATNADKATSALKQSTQAANENSQAHSALSSSLVSGAAQWVTLAAGIGAVSEVLKLGVQAAAEHEVAVARLDGILQATGQYSTEASISLQGLSESLARQTGNSREAMLATEALLVSFGASQQNVPRLTRLVADLSAGLKIDLSSAAMIVAKALEGNFTILRRWGVEVDANKTKTEQFASAVLQLESRFGGLSEKIKDTTWGAFQNLGRSIWQVLGDAFDGLNKQVGWLANSATGIVQGLNPVRRRENYDLDPQTGYLVYRPGPKPGEDDFVGPVDFNGPRLPRSADPAGVSGQTANAPGAEDAALKLAPGVQAEEQAAAVEKLKALEEQLVDLTLEGYAKEEAAADLAYGKRATQIEQLLHLAGDSISQQQAMRLRDENYQALEEAQKRIVEKKAAEEERAEEAQQAEDARIDAQIMAEAHKEAVKEISIFEKQLTADYEKSSLSRKTIAQQEYDARVAEYQRLYEEGGLTEEQLGDLMQEAAIKLQKALADAKTGFDLLGNDLQKLGTTAETTFASGLSNALVQGFRTGHFEFQKFASDFLAKIAEMILQALILRAIQSSISGLFGGGGVSGTAEPATSGVDASGLDVSGMAAAGTVRFAATGITHTSIPGVSELSRATYIPRHNVIAGEAGSEMLAVLAKPRVVNYAGIRAAVGNVGPYRVALTSADQLAAIGGARPLAAGGVSDPAQILGSPVGQGGGGPAGSVTIFVQLDQGLIATVQSNSIQGALVQVASQLRQNGPIAQNVKAIAAGKV